MSKHDISDEKWIVIESIMLDSSYVKLHHHGSGAKGGHFFRAIGEIKYAELKLYWAVASDLGRVSRNVDESALRYHLKSIV